MSLPRTQALIEKLMEIFDKSTNPLNGARRAHLIKQLMSEHTEAILEYVELINISEMLLSEKLQHCAATENDVVTTWTSTGTEFKKNRAIRNHGKQV